MRKDIYESPLSSRYASEYMLHLFSPDMRFQTWRRLWVALARAEHELGTKGPGQDGPGRETVYFPSLSGKTIVYKGMLTTPQLRDFYLDLQDGRVESALGLVHSRFSTNTFPSWPLAHPYRRVAHNGEINTVNGNENWMRAREALMDTSVLKGLSSRASTNWVSSCSGSFSRSSLR